MKSAEQDRKLTFREWLEHIWYYYKWQILILGLIAVFVIIATVQLFTKSDPDVGIMVVGKTTLTAEGTADFKEVCYSLMSDYNDDGEKSVNYLELTVSENGETTNAQYNSDLTALQRFNTEVASGNSIIYLVNEAYYERLKEFGVLAKLTDVLPASAIPAETVDEYGVYLRELEIHFAAGFAVLPGKLVLCIRRSPEQDDITYGRTMEYWRGNQLFSAACLNTSIRRRNRGEKAFLYNYFHIQPCFFTGYVV